jgi:hypothetical protein
MAVDEHEGGGVVGDELLELFEDMVEDLFVVEAAV